MKTWSLVSKLGAAMLLLSISSSGYAQEASPFSFSGPCSSQGVWTRAALAHTQDVKQVINKLKDNPACNSLKASISAGLSGIDDQLQLIDKAYESTDGKGQTLAKLPQEIMSLRSFSRDSSLFKENISQLLIGKTITQSALSSQQVDARVTTNSFKGATGGTQASLEALTQRTHRAASTGLSLFNSTLSAMQEAQANCLDDTQGASAVAGMVKVLSSFASSGDQGLSSQLSMAVQNLSQYLNRDQKYVKALRTLNDREFISSMSCLMEITTDGYCSALDAQYMFQEVTNSQAVKVETFTNKRTGQTEKRVVGLNESFSKKLEKGPLAGYYILSRQVPIVTDWIQKVQYGITPQLPTEADFQIGVSTNVYEHYNTMKKIEGTFNFQKKLMGELSDFKSKQTYVLQMLTDVAESMVGGRNLRSGASENFFSKVSTQNEIFFRLLGMPVPDAVLGTGPEGIQFANSPDRWLQVRYRNLPLFNDPDKLAEIIYENMQVLFKEATSIGIAYYNKYFIVDKIQVVNDSLLGLDANVRDALVNIDLYLANLELRIEQDSKDRTMVASIVDTRRRIGRILHRYRELHDYSVKLIQERKDNGNSYKTMDDAEMAKRLRQVGDNLLQQVYLDFDILTARTGFLSKRMSSFVFQDYTLSLRNRDEFNQYFDDLMLATGYNSLNTMMNMSQTEFSKVKTDLDQAMNIYKKNIDALEDVVGEAFIRNIFELKLMSLGKDLTDYERTKLVYEISQKAGSAKIPEEDSFGAQRAMRGFLNRVWNELTFKDKDLYGAPGFWSRLLMPGHEWGNRFLGKKGKIVVSPVSEFETAQGEMAKLCTQALAFPNLRPYWALCEDAVLVSPLMNKNVKDAEVKEMVQSYLSVNFVNKAYENIDTKKTEVSAKDRARNYQSRICALRDYHRRNEVARISSAMRDDGNTYQNPFTKEISDEVKIPAGSTAPSHLGSPTAKAGTSPENEN